MVCVAELVVGAAHLCQLGVIRYRWVARDMSGLPIATEGRISRHVFNRPHSRSVPWNVDNRPATASA